MQVLFSFYYITPFAELMECYLNGSIIKRAIDRHIIKVHFVNPRDFTNDKHKTIDDKPFGGGPGMVYMLKPFLKALESAKNAESDMFKMFSFSFLFSPAGKLFNSKFAQNFVEYFINEFGSVFNDFNTTLQTSNNQGVKPDVNNHANQNTDQNIGQEKEHINKQQGVEVRLIFILPRYEGIDSRIKNFVDAEISIGPYILTGAELPALVVTDALIRFIPGVLGNSMSLSEETSFLHKDQGCLQVVNEADVFTRPAKFEINNKQYNVPDVLLSGNHQQIQKWRQNQQIVKDVELLTLQDVL